MKMWTVCSHLQVLLRNGGHQDIQQEQSSRPPICRALQADWSAVWKKRDVKAIQRSHSVWNRHAERSHLRLFSTFMTLHHNLLSLWRDVLTKL